MPVWWQTGGIALGLGALLGFEAALLSSLLYRIEDLFHRLPVHWMWWPAIGGVVVGIGGLIDAHVLGAGYSNIQALLDGTLVARVVLALLVVELTGHFDALPSTIAASAGAYAVSVLIMRRSILTEKIARRGRHVLQEYTVDPLDFLQAAHRSYPVGD